MKWAALLLTGAFLTGSATILCWQLFVPPIVGLADNGDYSRLLGPAGLAHTPDSRDDTYFAYLRTKYEMHPKWRTHYFSSETVFVRIASAVNSVWSRQSFDIRFLGAIHAAAYLLALGSLALGLRSSSWWKRLIGCALLVFIFLDVGYVAYFNSFYCEPASTIGLLLTLGTTLILIHHPHSGRGTAGLIAAHFLACLLFTTAKPQNVPLGLILAVFSVRLFHLKFAGAPQKRLKVLCVGLAICLVAASVAHFSWGIPGSVKRVNLYNSVFYGILNGSNEPASDLQALGLNPDLAYLAGTNGCQRDIPVFGNEFTNRIFAKINRGTVLKYYATHPARAVAVMKRVIENAYTLRYDTLGNCEKASGLPPFTQGRFWSSWSTLKEVMFPKSSLFLVIFFLGCVGLVFLKRFWLDFTASARLMSELHMLVLVMAAGELIIVPLGDGLSDLPKHLFLFNSLFDASLFFLFLNFASVCKRAIQLAARRHYSRQSNVQERTQDDSTVVWSLRVEASESSRDVVNPAYVPERLQPFKKQSAPPEISPR